MVISIFGVVMRTFGKMRNMKCVMIHDTIIIPYFQIIEDTFPPNKID